MNRRILTALTFVGLFLAQTLAQGQSELDKLEDKVSHHIRTKMPGWNYKRGEPMPGTSKDVLTEFWRGSNRVVKISIMPHQSAEEARQSLQEFIKYDREIEQLKGFGDEAYLWGYGLSNLVFRRGRFNVYVSTVADVDDDADVRTLTQSKKNERMRIEMKRLNQEFAKHVSTAIDIPD